MDLVFRCSRFPNPGETLLGTDFSEHPGGKGANQAVAIGKLGNPVSFVGCVGKDGFGVTLIRQMKGSGVETSTMAIHDSLPSGTAMILVDEAGQNQIVVVPGANGAVTKELVNASIQSSTDSFIVAQLEIPLEAVIAGSKLGKMILNPAPARELPDEIFSELFAIIPNESETEFLTGIRPVDADSCKAASAWFLENGVQNVVLTLGERGSYWSNGIESLSIPAFRVGAIDTTAAGDAFVGGLASRLSIGEGWQDALQFASAVAALAVTKPGAQESMPTRSEVEAFLASQ